MLKLNGGWWNEAHVKNRVALSQPVRQEPGHTPRASSRKTPVGKEQASMVLAEPVLGQLNNTVKSRGPQMTPLFPQSGTFPL